MKKSMASKSLLKIKFNRDHRRMDNYLQRRAASHLPQKLKNTKKFAQISHCPQNSELSPNLLFLLEEEGGWGVAGPRPTHL